MEHIGQTISVLRGGGDGCSIGACEHMSCFSLLLLVEHIVVLLEWKYLSNVLVCGLFFGGVTHGLSMFDKRTPNVWEKYT